MLGAELRKIGSLQANVSKIDFFFRSCAANLCFVQDEPVDSLSRFYLTCDDDDDDL